MTDDKLPCGYTADHLTAAAERWGFNGIPADPEGLQYLLALEAKDPTPEPVPVPARDPLQAEAEDYRRAPRDRVAKPKWEGDNSDLEAMTGTNQPITGFHGVTDQIDHGLSNGVGPIYYGTEGDNDE